MDKAEARGVAQAPASMTRKQLAAMLSVSSASVARWDRAGTGPTWFRYPGSNVVRYLRRDVESWLAAQVAAGSKAEG